jgi:phage-related baseplate assembly protein
MLAPELAEVIDLESEPALTRMQVGAWRELIMRARANDSVRAVLLAAATGADLDQLVANLSLIRQTIVEADADAVPPVEAVYETDDALRSRAQLSWEALSNAGTVGAYTFHALSADPLVRGVAVTRPAPGIVLVTILSHDGDGTPTPALLTSVQAALEEVRPLCDDVRTAAPDIEEFALAATLHVTSSTGADLVRAAALEAVTEYVQDDLAVGRVVRLTALLARLHQSGVETVTLTAPTADIDPGRTGIARATSITLTVEVMP